MQRLPILMYHSISDNPRHGFRRFAVSPAVFTEQMAYLYHNGYCPLTVSALVEVIQGRAALPEKPVLLTFDDGFADFFTQCLPILLSYQFAATLYLVTAYIGQTGRWLEQENEADRPMLTWEQIQHIAASGIECGSHTHTHPRLDGLPLARVRDEIETSKELLDSHLPSPARSMCYPYGCYSDAVQQAVQQAGYTSACAVRYELSSPQDDMFALSRLSVTPEMSSGRLAALIEGRTAQTIDRVRSAGYRALRHFLYPRPSN
jgi:peptidoglycan/xylan/chitin deacetylase (PgdA/CDA1 family)